MSFQRVCLFVAGVLFIFAALLAFGVVKASAPIEGLALLGFAFWALSGAA